MKPKNVDEYIALFPSATKEKLNHIRQIIKSSAPQAEECISYQMPTYKYHGPLVYFAGYKSHIGFYPTPSAIIAFKEELTMYKTSKGAIQFTLSNKLPEQLIQKIIAFRLDENIKKA